MPADDGELVRRTLEGDWEAFSALVDRYRDAVCGVAYHHLGDFEEAQDAAQEALVRAYVRLRQLREPGKFGPWLRRITSTICADLLRRRGDRMLSLEEGTPAPAAGAPDDAERVAARLVVREALARLSQQSQLTVALYYIDGYTAAEIADFLAVPVNTVRTRIHRAKAKLREELIAMVSDVLHEGRPDAEFAKRVVEEAMGRGDEARNAHATGEALRHFDEGLAALEKMPAGPERQKLRMDLLWRKGGVSEFSPGRAEAAALYEQALAVAEEIGAREQQAALMVTVGTNRANMGESEKAREWYERARGLYHEIGDANGEASCLFWLASQHLFGERLGEAKPYVEEAVELFKRGNSPMWVAVCYATLGLMREVGEQRFSDLAMWGAGCVGLEERDGVVSFAFEPGIGYTDGESAPSELSTTVVFWQMSHAGKLLDPSVPVGGGWSGDAFSYSYQPLKARVTVKSTSERITVPAGTFEGCLLVEQVTEESGLRDDAPEQKRKLNLEVFCGTRRAWYARGVGLVKLDVRRADGVEAVIQLREFSVADGGDAYLPLALGNEWAYEWAGLPEGYVSKDAYRVATREGAAWCLEHYAFAYGAGAADRPQS